MAKDKGKELRKYRVGKIRERRAREKIQRVQRLAEGRSRGLSGGERGQERGARRRRPGAAAAPAARGGGGVRAAGRKRWKLRRHGALLLCLELRRLLGLPALRLPPASLLLFPAPPPSAARSLAGENLL